MPTTHKIRVTSKAGSLSVDTPELNMTVGEVVSWSLTPDSLLASSLTITFASSNGFSSTQFALNNTAFSLTAITPGEYTYTISTGSGSTGSGLTLTLDPVIIVNHV